jgi:5-formyltetrahydrofolate cyclo-ligase
MVAGDKNRLRKEIAMCRANLAPEERCLKSKKIRESVLGLEELNKSQCVMLYLNIRDEVETFDLAKDILLLHKRLIIPLCKDNIMVPCEIISLNDDLEAGYMGLKEPNAKSIRPINVEDIDSVFVPGLVFDREGRRIGYGKGYYDRFLPQLKEGTPIIGLAFACQVLDRIDTEKHDHRMSLLVTENGVIYQR